MPQKQKHRVEPTRKAQQIEKEATEDILIDVDVQEETFTEYNTSMMQILPESSMIVNYRPQFQLLKEYSATPNLTGKASKYNI